MRALYSLITHARTVCALGQAVVTFVRAGPSALAPLQLLALGCGLCLLIAGLVPSPRSSASRRAVFLDRLCGVIAAVAVIGLAAIDTIGSCVFLGRFTLGV